VTVAVDTSCTACGACIMTCPTSALSPSRLRPAVDDHRCIDCLACLEVCPVDAIRPWPNDEVHPIEVESYRILNERVDLSGWPDGARQVVARMIHATADESFATSARIGTAAVTAAVGALRAQVPVVCDSRMVLAGIASVPGSVCFLDEVETTPSGVTRSAAAIGVAAGRHPNGALWIIGNAPTALVEMLRLHAAGAIQPAAVIGVPVGYVGAAEAKAALWDSDLRSVAITNTGERGGSPVAAAALNALHRLARGTPTR
jgi:precorrin-8X/cobalt-precorrin-8 methylmutase